MKPTGYASRLYKPVYAQGIITSIVEDLRAAATVSHMVRLVNEVFSCINIFDLDITALYNQIHNLLYLVIMVNLFNQ